jgi:hypothetical protein
MGSKIDDILITNWIKNKKIKIVVGETKLVDGRMRTVVDMYDADKDTTEWEKYQYGDQINLTLSEGHPLVRNH